MAEKKTDKRQSATAKKEKGATSTAQKKPAEPVKKKQREDYQGQEDKKDKRKQAEEPKRSSGNTKNTKKEKVNVFEESERSRRAVHQLMPYVLLVVALFTLICFLLIDVFKGLDANRGVGVVGIWIHNVLCGLFGPGAFFVPAVLAILGAGWRSAVEKNALLAKNLYAFSTIWMFSAFLHALRRTALGEGAYDWKMEDGLRMLWDWGVDLQGGGVIGGLLGELLGFVGMAGVLIIGITFSVVFATLLCGLTPSYVATLIRYRYKIWSEAQAEKNKVRREEKAIAKAEAEEEARREKEKREAQRKLEEAEMEARREQLALEAAERKQQLRQLEKEERAAEKAQKKREPEKQEESTPLLILPAADAAVNEERVAEETPVVYTEPETKPLLIIPPTTENHTEKKVEKPSEDDGVYHSLEALKDAQANDEKEFSLTDIFNEEKAPLSKEDKDKLERAPVKEAEEDAGKFSETDMTLLAQMKEITDVDVVPDLEDGIEEIEVEPEPEQEQEYVFAPITMLAEDTNAKDEDVTEELVANAQKLMDTLKSFKVGIKEITYSRGPTITRYELKPDVGIRVRSIANLVDDIALSLATTGVRIEAPIPNKPAVGIEVPNKNANTVFLRSLIDTEKFSGESSKLTACLGADVAGKPIYFNIAKMPHLLIAGATGLGKSVCINSISVSLLYKARPDEVKLILIDPKKVEFNIYKDIPHLYAPIVSDPAKAAGALASAVAEMERRFELIEEVGVRDIYNYNAVTKDDPDKEFMPQMVIIIDELADLMMTAADSVESSICRLAQKARAAGIHIIIGTQRPSVDVITGLIKANVPSRIAFTVASQVDSRTIIDIAGAEKLIGRGDMLFAPVGAPKPMRVQGAFVSESEVERIVDFIKANNCAAKYNDEFMSRIEEEAAKCASGGKKGSSGGGSGMPESDMDSDGLDPKFREAVKVAVESGRIATSLLQRKLEIGYGRAAKIIDQMEERGYVSAAEGNKPRRILISKGDFMQMTINDDI